MLEFVPLARHFWDTGRAFDVYRSIGGGATICGMYEPAAEGEGRGRCSVYPRRGFICRWFGFVAARDEARGHRLMTCRLIQTVHREAVAELDGLFLGAALPRWPETRERFEAIEPSLARERLPVNKALRRAIEVVFETGYRPQSPRTIPRAA